MGKSNNVLVESKSHLSGVVFPKLLHLLVRNNIDKAWLGRNKRLLLGSGDSYLSKEGDIHINERANVYSVEEYLEKFINNINDSVSIYQDVIYNINVIQRKELELYSLMKSVDQLKVGNEGRTLILEKSSMRLIY